MIELHSVGPRPVAYRARLAARVWLARLPENETAILIGLLVTVLPFAALLAKDPGTMPPISALAPFVVLGGLFLQPLRALLLFVVIMLCVLTILWRSDLDLRASALPVAGQLTIMSFMMWVSESRARLGVLGMQGESMLVDLRDRLRRGGEIPAMPAGWHASQTVHSAHGAKFAGDFVNTALTQDGTLFEIALVDVSGKGSRAGTRALLLSGAFGGLLGSMPPQDFLGAANAYLLRQQWPDGFATCVHLAVDLRTGDYSIGTAGHPPVACHDAAAGEWSLAQDPTGPLLGVISDAAFPRSYGRLGPHDILLAYTDGVVETRNEDLQDGINRMLKVADGVRARGAIDELGEAVCAAALSGDTDDRAAVVISRR